VYLQLRFGWNSELIPIFCWQLSNHITPISSTIHSRLVLPHVRVDTGAKLDLKICQLVPTYREFRTSATCKLVVALSHLPINFPAHGAAPQPPTMGLRVNNETDHIRLPSSISFVFSLRQFDFDTRISERVRYRAEFEFSEQL
jgi:hypothetical protein